MGMDIVASAFLNARHINKDPKGKWFVKFLTGDSVTGTIASANPGYRITDEKGTHRYFDPASIVYIGPDH